jgi:hypothetical protein
MIDMDPRLDSMLRAKYDRIEAENPPPMLANFDPAVERPRRKVVNLMVGAAGIAVVAAGVAAFGLQLSGHGTAPAPTANSSSSGAQHAPEGFPSLSSSRPFSAFPLLAGETYAEGSASLPAFTPTEQYWIEYACLGTGSIDILSSDGSVHFTSESCVSPGINGLMVPQDQIAGRPVSLRVETTTSTGWELWVMQSNGAPSYSYEGAPPSPHSGPPVGFTVPAGATPLIPNTHGMGSATLPTFTLTTPYYRIVLTCSGSGSVEIIGSDGSTTSRSCSVPGISAGDSAHEKSGVPISMVLNADPGTTWEIIVYGVNTQLAQS